MLDPFWDKPSYSAETLARLRTERAGAALQIEMKKTENKKLWEVEQELRKQMQEVRDKMNALRTDQDKLQHDYERYSTIEIDFADQIRKAEELAKLEDRITELEEKLRQISEGQVFWEQLMPFQKEDLLYMTNAYEMGFTGVMNANDMGLGKTFSTVAFDYLATRLFYATHGEVPSRIWVTKKSLVNSTCREFKKWFPDVSVLPLSGATPAERNAQLKLARQFNLLLVCNYEALTTTPEIQKHTWNFIYMDEVHRLKGGSNNKPTQLWTSARDLVFNSRLSGKSFFMPLSGSPIQNHPKEMWAYLHIFDPNRFDTVRRFEREFCAWVGTGIKINPEFLIKAMKSQIIRRTMREVRDQLALVLKDPIYIRHEIDNLPEQDKLYKQMRDEFWVWVGENEDVLTASIIIARLNRLRQFVMWPDEIVGRPVGSAKIDEAMDIIDELTNAGEQVVVFSSQYNSPLDEIAKRLREFYQTPVEVIKGGTKDIDDVCERFRQGEIKVLCINAKSGGEGLNLQKSESWPGGASHVIMLDLWWNPKANEQAIARVYRTGQTDVVTVHTLHANNTVDSYIDNILESKTMMIDSIMEVDDLRKTKKTWKESLEGLI